MFLVYSRVSTQEQADPNGSSLVEQNRKGKAIAQLRNATMFDIATYEDAGVSGSIILNDRPKGGLMLRDAQQGDTIISSKMDRLFRSAIDALQTAEDLKKRGVDLILIDMGVEPVTGNGVGKMFFGVLALLAEFERERILERTADGRKAKRQKSGHCGGPPPFGYDVKGSGKEAALVPNETEQEALKQIRTIWHSHTPAAACKAVNAAGLRCRAGTEWQVGQLKRVAERAIANGR